MSQEPETRPGATGRCAYLTMDDMEGWSIDVDLCVEPLGELGWQLEAIRWRTDAPDWSHFDAVYIGVPWDYPEDPERFLDTLAAIDRSDALLVNDLSLVRWSLEKTYLGDLELRGGDIVPTLFLDGIDTAALADAFARWETDTIIVKPVIGTNATDTFVLSQDDWRSRVADLQSTFAGRSAMVQPFIANIRDEGEFSMFYIGGEFSHAIQKVPKAGDYRVQEEHGATIRPVAPEARLLAAANKIMGLVAPSPVYARADFVRGPDGRFLVMELELIEPSMYLRMDPEAPGRFARAFDRYVRQATGETS